MGESIITLAEAKPTYGEIKVYVKESILNSRLLLSISQVKQKYVALSAWIVDIGGRTQKEPARQMYAG